jgi:hypothetical protein
LVSNVAMAIGASSIEIVRVNVSKIILSFRGIYKQNVGIWL